MALFKPTPTRDADDEFSQPYAEATPKDTPNPLSGAAVENILEPKSNGSSVVDVNHNAVIASTKAIAERLKSKLPDFEARISDNINQLDSCGLTNEYLANELREIITDPDNRGFVKYKAVELAYRLNGGFMAKSLVQKKTEAEGGIHFHFSNGIKPGDILLPQLKRANPNTIVVEPIEDSSDGE